MASAASPTLLLRDEISSPVGSVTSCDYNFRDHELVVTNGAVLQLYSGLATDDVQLRHTWQSHDGEVLVRVVYVEWANTFLVFCLVGSALHRRLLQPECPGNMLEDIGVLCHEGTLLDVAKNPGVHELVTTDSLGGIRMWSIRGAGVSAGVDAARHSSGGGFGGVAECTSSSSPPKKSDSIRCSTRLHVQDAKNTAWHALCVDSQHQRIVAASSRAIKVFDALSGAVLAKCLHATRTPAPLVRRLVYLPHVHNVLAVGSGGVDMWDMSSLKLDPQYVQVHPFQEAVESEGVTDEVASCCVTNAPCAFATKFGFAAVAFLTAGSKVAVVPCADQEGSSTPSISFQLKSLALPTDAALDGLAGAPPTLADPRKGFTGGFLFCNLQYTGRNFFTLVQTHAHGSCIRVVEVLSTQSTSRMLSASTRLFSLREIPFTLPSSQRGQDATTTNRRGYSLFGGSATVKSVQLFEDVALPVCELALPRHEGVDFPDLDTERSVPEPVICFLEYSTLLAKVIVGWSDGVLDLFSLNGQRWRLLKRPSGVMADCVCTVQLPGGVVGFVAGDAHGSLETWLIEPHASTYNGIVAAHSENIVSIQNPAAMPLDSIDAGNEGTAEPNSLSSNPAPSRPSIVTTAFDGQIKLWEWTAENHPSSEADDDIIHNTTGWRLVGLFKTHSINISVAKLVDRSHLCCGCESGAVELWTLPQHPGKGATSLLTSKKAILFSPTAHSSTVSDIALHHGVGSSIDHDFTLLATMARDHTILFWFFAGETCVPFRCILASTYACGGYFSTAATPNAVSFLCCLSSGVDRVLVLPRLKKQVLALVLHATNHPSLLTAPAPAAKSSPVKIYNDSPSLLYEPLDIPLQLTIPTVHMHMIPNEEVADAIGRQSPQSPQRHLQNPPTRHLMLVKLAHEHDVLGVPVNMSQSTVATPSDQGDAPAVSNASTAADNLPPGWAVHGQLVRRKSASQPQTTAVPRAYRNISRRTNAPRVYRQPPPAVNAPREVRPLRAGIVSAFGILSSTEEAPPKVSSPPRLQRRRDAIMTPKPATAGERGLESGGKSAKNLHLVELATRPATNPHAPLFWLDAHGERSHTAQATGGDMEPASSPDHAHEFNVDSLFIPWDDLSPDQQFVEIQASLHTKAVRDVCLDAGLDLPPSCFNLELPTSVPDKVLYHKYMFWYSKKASQARSLFLRQELMFATEDAKVVEDALKQGIAIPKRTDCDSVNSSSPMFYRWCRYVAWYCRGFVLQHHHLQALGAVDYSVTPHYPQRLVDRTALLRARLHETDVALQNFAKLQAKEIAKQKATLNAAAIMLNKLHKLAPPSSKSTLKPVLPPELQSLDVDFFHDIELPDGQVLDFVPWESLTLMEQQKELAVAMHDTVVRWQAMKAHIAMPQLASVVAADDVDDDQLTNQCAAFITWWSTPHNTARIQFLKAEAHEAAQNPSVKAAASVAGVALAFHDAVQMFTHPRPEAAPPASSTSAYHDWYFRTTHAADSARVDFLKQKVLMLQRQKRFELVIEMGRLPPPVVYSMSPAVLIAYDTDPAQAVAVVEVEEVATDAADTDGQNATAEAAQDLADNGVDADALEREKAALREQWEAAQLVSNRKQMELEDDAAHLMRLTDDDGDDTGDAPTPRVRPERDYSVTYFFNTMPGAKEAAVVAATGWASGCGLDNCDEEVEEREVREVERLRQLELDAIDRARIAEEERVAALLLAEQLREDERKAQKRARQVEVKRILAWQRDEATRREVEASLKRIEQENAAMANEDSCSRQAWLQLDAERQSMGLADLESSDWARRSHEHEERRVAMLASDRRHMLREDVRSRHAAEYAEDTARQAAEKEAFLRELYTPFDPYFPDSEGRRCLRTSHARQRPNSVHDGATQRRPMTQHAASKLVSGQYAVPFADALELSAPESEVYQAQASHRFQALLGLPIQYRRPTKSHMQNVAASLDTLARARSVPGLPRPRTTTEDAVPLAECLHPPSATSRPRTQAFVHESLQAESIHSPSLCRDELPPSRARTTSRSTKHRRRVLAETTQLAPLPSGASSNNQTEPPTSPSPSHHRRATPHRDDAAHDHTNPSMYRQLSLPPPFFRGNLAVVGQKPTTAPSAIGGDSYRSSRRAGNSTKSAASLFVRLPHGAPPPTLYGTQPPLASKPSSHPSLDSEDYGFGRPEHDLDTR